MENKEPALIFTLRPFPHQEPQAGQEEAEALLGPSEEQASLGWAFLLDPIPTTASRADMLQPPLAGLVTLVSSGVREAMSEVSFLSLVVMTCLLQHVKIEMYGYGNPSLKAQPVLLRAWLNKQANPHQTFLHVFHPS